jgi:predicted helicase
VSRQLINEYRSDLDRIIKVGGSLNEGSVRDAFQGLLKSWGRSNDLTYLSEHKMMGSGGNIFVDGALVYDIRVPFGYWEAKDSKDDLEEEIRKKEAKGYPKTNIVYEDTKRAILIQDGKRAAEADMTDTEELYSLLTTFFGYEQAAIRDFRKAIAKFAEDLPAILEALRDRIREKREASTDFAKAEETFLKQVKETINPALERADVTEMLIQHILTEDIFNRVFDMRDYHRDNNIAKQLYALERKLFEYGDKRTLLQALRPYYTGIEETAHLIQSHSEKQNFLKSLYENFYKVYNPKAADRLGVVYTPGEIVRFMIRSADWLCEKHFGKNLVDPGVEILDPATGTGTYIVELLEYFRGQPDKLRHKYKEELHANEVAILPYYVANLNIEATYQAITGQFAEFEGLCLVDTLDNVDGLGIHSGHQFDMLGALSDENIERVKRQNRRKISVIIGNPPYNANQLNENDNNKNRKYPHIDKRIRETYEARTTSHKAKSYDMYSRFIRWASDRIVDNGIVAFVANRSFVSKRSFDGFRKVAAEQFKSIHVVDLFGDARDSKSQGGNVFPNRIGTAIIFLVKGGGGDSGVQISEIGEGDGDDKLSILGSASIRGLTSFTAADPSDGDWSSTGLTNPSDGLLLVPAKLSGTKSEKSKKAIFEAGSFGYISARDEWVSDRDHAKLTKKVKRYIEVYSTVLDGMPDEKVRNIENRLDYEIKWSADLRKHLESRRRISFKESAIRSVLFRPFSVRYHYHDGDLNWSLYRLPAYFPHSAIENRSIYFSDRGARNPFTSLATDMPAEYHLAASTDGFQGISRYRYNKSGERIDNITDWALNKFTKHYGKKVGVTKEAIFAYCYAVLHDPVYREKYALNLKREFPRIPFYPDFAQWVAWGETLLDLHIDYEDVEPYSLERVDTPNPKRANGTHPKPKLKSVLADGAETGSVVVDEDTRIASIPAAAWDYRLGNRSAIDWVLDQHKEKKPRDPTIAAKFNTYRFADYKENMIELLAKIVTVSVETNSIVEKMAHLDRTAWEDPSSD